MRKLLSLTFIILVLGLTGTAQAMDLSSAKASGLVGETQQGLIGIVTPPGSTDLQALVNSTNAARLKMYTETANKQGVTVSQVQALMAEKLYAKTPSGYYIQSNGNWVRK